MKKTFYIAKRASAGVLFCIIIRVTTIAGRRHEDVTAV